MVTVAQAVDSIAFDPPIPEMTDPLKAMKNLLSGSMKIGFYGSTQPDSTSEHHLKYISDY